MARRGAASERELADLVRGLNVGQVIALYLTPDHQIAATTYRYALTGRQETVWHLAVDRQTCRRVAPRQVTVAP